MLHFSTDRLAGLDTVVLKITTPPKVPTLIPNHALHHDIPVKKQNETRTPLAPCTNLLHPPKSSMLLHTANLFPPSSPCALGSPDLPTFRPLPPLPSSSILQLPSFLNLSTRSLTLAADPPPRSTASLPPSVLLSVSSPIPSSRRVVARKTRINKVFEGPQWIPAFHHPNSPYVPWSSPVRRRILPPLSPLQSPVCPSPCIRSGAIAPEPWAPSTFSQAQNRSAKQKISSSWKGFKNSIKKGVKTVVSRLGKSKTLPSTYDDTDVAQPNAMESSFAERHVNGPRDSLASFVSSDSTTLAVWLAERRANASCVTNDTPREMSMEEYELVGSWLDLRPCDGGWVCGVQDCGMHTASGSPCAASDYSNGLRMAMPFDGADMHTVPRQSPRAAVLPFPDGPFSAPPRFHSLPRLPCQSFDMHSAQEGNAGRCLNMWRELSMPGGWTFN